MKTGICGFCFPRGLPFAEQVRIAADAGFEGIEVFLWDEKEFDDGPAGTPHADVPEVAEQAGIEICGVAPVLLWQYTFTSPSPEYRRKAEEVTARLVALAAQYGAANALVIPGVVVPELPYRQAWDFAVASFKRLGEVAREAGVCLALENGGGRFLMGPVEWARFIDEIASDGVGVYLDTANTMLDGGYPAHWIEILGGRVKQVHFKDFGSGAMPYPYCGLLHGSVDWPAVMESLRKVGYDGWAVAEVPPYVGNYHGSIAHTYDALKFLLGGKLKV